MLRTREIFGGPTQKRSAMLTGAPRATPLSATQQEGDDRPAQVIVRSAADRIGKANAAASVIDALENADIHWAWQLAHLPWDANEWLRFGISPGLKVAIAAELTTVAVDRATILVRGCGPGILRF